MLVDGLRPGRLGDSAARGDDVRLGADPADRSPRSARSNSPSSCCARRNVAVAPGVGFGEDGEGYVRIALVENEQRLRQAARGVRKVMANADALLAKHHAEEAAA